MSDDASRETGTTSDERAALEQVEPDRLLDGKQATKSDRVITGAELTVTLPPPPGAEAHRALERIFTSQASGPVQLDGVLQINGRDIPYRKRADNILWFDFEALCEGPRAVADYIALAKAGPAIIISNVPQFTVYSEDAAKRFDQSPHHRIGMER